MAFYLFDKSLTINICFVIILLYIDKQMGGAMNQNTKQETQTITIPNGSSLTITVPEDTVICDMCGSVNSSDKLLCRVCSNYLKDEEEF